MIIGRLRGEVAALGEDTVMIDIGGVAYVAVAGSRLLSRLSPGMQAELHVETRVTEATIILYAFESDAARAWFVRLQDVPGVGGKAALAITDALSPGDLADAVALGDLTAITRAKGVGKRLAERIVGELSGKPPPLGRFGRLAGSSPSGDGTAGDSEGRLGTTQSGARSEAVSALTNLGYATTEAGRAVAAAVAAGTPDDDLGALIKGALKELAP